MQDLGIEVLKICKIYDYKPEVIQTISKLNENFVISTVRNAKFGNIYA